MKHLIFIALILFLTISCNKKTAVLLQAQDYNTGDGSTYAGQEYTVVKRALTSDYIFTFKTKTVSTGFLDANGHASFDLKTKRNREYAVGVKQPGNICYGGLVASQELENGNNNTINFDFLTCATLDISINNINCEGLNDQFQMKFYYSDNTDVYPGHHIVLEWSDFGFVEGCVNYSNTLPRNYYSVPNGDYTVEWRVIRTSGTITGIDYFTISENDTTTYVIEY